MKAILTFRSSLLIKFATLSILCILGCFVMVQTSQSAEPSSPIALWPKVAPGENGDIGPEAEVVRKDERKTTRITNISNPTLTLFRPTTEKNTGAAVIVCPGGGYSYVVADKEGSEVAEWLSTIGVTGVLLKYRVPIRKDRLKHEPPLQDAQRAIGLLRHRASEFGIKPDHIGIMGFSAGGHVAACASTNFAARTYEVVDEADKQSCRPDFSLLIYPAYLTLKDEGDKLAPEVPVSPKTPPTFLMMTQDDGVRVESALFYYLALKQAKVPAELHLYPSGGHGYGLRLEGHTAATWPQRAEDWLLAGGWLTK
ncbi:MAG: alpha/beta hydrolase [Planctomycetia bacterium]|nr:alpha/beta hydrolase [Planctomycetia bacterium]